MCYRVALRCSVRCVIVFVSAKMSLMDLLQVRFPFFLLFPTVSYYLFLFRITRFVVVIRFRFYFHCTILFQDFVPVDGRFELPFWSFSLSRAIEQINTYNGVMGFDLQHIHIDAFGLNHMMDGHGIFGELTISYPNFAFSTACFKRSVMKQIFVQIISAAFYFACLIIIHISFQVPIPLATRTVCT